MTAMTRIREITRLKLEILRKELKLKPDGKIIDLALDALAEKIEKEGIQETANQFKSDD